MKVNIFLSLIAFFIGALICYGLYPHTPNWYEALAASIAPTLYLFAAMGISIKDAPRSTVFFRIFSVIILIILVIINSILITSDSNIEKYLLWNGILSSIGASVLYSIAKNKQ